MFNLTLYTKCRDKLRVVMSFVCCLFTCTRSSCAVIVKCVKWLLGLRCVTPQIFGFFPSCRSAVLPLVVYQWKSVATFMLRKPTMAGPTSATDRATQTMISVPDAPGEPTRLGPSAGRVHPVRKYIYLN